MAKSTAPDLPNCRRNAERDGCALAIFFVLLIFGLGCIPHVDADRYAILGHYVLAGSQFDLVALDPGARRHPSVPKQNCRRPPVRASPLWLPCEPPLAICGREHLRQYADEPDHRTACLGEKYAPAVLRAVPENLHQVGISRLLGCRQPRLKTLFPRLKLDEARGQLTTWERTSSMFSRRLQLTCSIGTFRIP